MEQTMNATAPALYRHRMFVDGVRMGQQPVTRWVQDSLAFHQQRVERLGPLAQANKRWLDGYYTARSIKGDNQ